MEFAELVAEINKKKGKVRALLYPPKLSSRVVEMLTAARVDVALSSKTVPRFMVEIGNGRDRCISLSMNFNSSKERHHDYAFSSINRDIVAQYAAQWHVMANECE
jgi:hypothetical protein